MKTHSRLGTEGNFSARQRASIKQTNTPKGGIIFNEIRSRVRCLSSLPVSIFTEGPFQYSKALKTKRQIDRNEVNICNTIVYVDDPKESIKKLLELRSEFSKVGEYRVSKTQLYFCILAIGNKLNIYKDKHHL